MRDWKTFEYWRKPDNETQREPDLPVGRSFTRWITYESDMSIFHLESLLVGLYTLRGNPLRTLLSTLGVIIGVAALVAVLSLGDSLEAFSRRQIEQTTDLLSVSLTPRTVDRVNGLMVPRKNAADISAEDVPELQRRIDGLGHATLTLTGSGWMSLDQDSVESAMLIQATVPGALELDASSVDAGRFLDWNDFDAETPVAVLSRSAALEFAPEERVHDLVGRSLGTGEKIVGVLAAREKPRSPTVMVPFDTRNRLRIQDPQHFVNILFRANNLEDVPAIVSVAETWAAEQDDLPTDAFIISSSSARVSQASQVMMVFKLALGSIAGISLLVGGIGIMNILLASVTERTREIGVRRATGARKGHILVQFLSESVVISVAGSAIGASVGIGATYLITWIIGMVTEAPIPTVFSASSLLFAAAAALVIGLIFGTYPARQAARIEPAVAMRYE